jgi:hypothetical protein
MRKGEKVARNIWTEKEETILGGGNFIMRSIII